MSWYLRQLLPLTYRTRYYAEDGKKHFCVWNMFLGRCYNIEDYIIGD
jgi:hypothetical protein